MSGTILPFRGLWPKIHPEAFIAETATVIGDVEIGPGASIWYGCVLRGDVNKIRVGAGTNLQDGTILHGNHDRKGDYRETGGGMATIVGDGVVVTVTHRLNLFGFLYLADRGEEFSDSGNAGMLDVVAAL